MTGSSAELYAFSDDEGTSQRGEVFDFRKVFFLSICQCLLSECEGQQE
jgi:hypothetical protein